MIRSSEIQKIANLEKVRDTQIEKDYVLSWILIGISKSPILRSSLAFKGGTVLKKFYFNDYRYSEDLDFTLINQTNSNDDIQNAFKLIFDYILDETNISLLMDDFTIHNTGNINFYISYIGPLGGVGSNKRVKVDISRSELLCFPLEWHSMIKKYSDQSDIKLQCYSLNEVLTEKMRSLISRSQPRDYYDLWYLSDVCGLEMVENKIEFEQKARHNLNFPFPCTINSSTPM